MMSFEKGIVLSYLIGCVGPITKPLVILACRLPWHHMLLREKGMLTDALQLMAFRAGVAIMQEQMHLYLTKSKNGNGAKNLSMLYSYVLITKGMFGEEYSARPKGKPNKTVP